MEWKKREGRKQRERGGEGRNRREGEVGKKGGETAWSSDLRHKSSDLNSYAPNRINKIRTTLRHVIVKPQSLQDK